MEAGEDSVEEVGGPTCIDCDHAFELPDDITTVACGAHNVFRDALHPACCEQFILRQQLTESTGIEIRHEEPR